MFRAKTFNRRGSISQAFGWGAFDGYAVSLTNDRFLISPTTGGTAPCPNDDLLSDLIGGLDTLCALCSKSLYCYKIVFDVFCEYFVPFLW